MNLERLRNAIREIPDFPRPGIGFKDVTPLLADPDLFREAVDALAARHRDEGIDVVAGVEARGFIFASALAYALGAGLCLLRKPGKLPAETLRIEYALEYGTDALEIHADAFQPGQRVLLADDLLATGGTAAAAARLIRENFDVNLVSADFLVELSFLDGRKALHPLPVYSLIRF